MTIFLRDWLVKRIRSNVLRIQKHPQKHAFDVVDQLTPIFGKTTVFLVKTLFPNDPFVMSFMIFYVFESKLNYTNVKETFESGVTLPNLSEKN